MTEQVETEGDTGGTVTTLPVVPQEEPDAVPEPAAAHPVENLKAPDPYPVKLEDALAIHDPAVLDSLAGAFKEMGNTHGQAWEAIHHLLRLGFHIRQHG